MTAGLAAIAALGAVAALVVAHYRSAPAVPAPVPRPPAAAAGRDALAERALATRPMLWLPAQVAEPHALTTRTAGPAITLPTPATREGQWIPDTFPDTPQGALAQLAALDEAAVAGGDPDTYARAYTGFALPAAPTVGESGLHTVLSRFRQAARIPPGTVTPDLTVRYEVTHGLIKGTVDDGRYVVACVLGQFSADVHGSGTALGLGDCQALRWNGSGWRISDGPRAAYASSAWPGTEEAVNAGYRALTGGGR